MVGESQVARKKVIQRGLPGPRVSLTITNDAHPLRGCTGDVVASAEMITKIVSNCQCERFLLPVSVQNS